MLANLIIIIFVSFCMGTIFLFSGIIGSLMIEAISTNGIVRDFAIAGAILGAVLATLGLTLGRKKKHDRG